MTGTLQPLSKQFAIVDSGGLPTDYFIRWAQQKQIDIGSSVTSSEAQTLIDQAIADFEANRSINTVAPLSGGGTLENNLTLSHNESGVTAGTYGSATESAVITVDEYGHVTNISEETIAGGSSSLATLTDVDMTTAPTDGQALVYSSSESKWKPGTVSGGGGSGGSREYFNIVSDLNTATNSGSFAHANFGGALMIMDSDATIDGVAFWARSMSSSNTLTPAIYTTNAAGAPTTLLATGPTVTGLSTGLIKLPLTSSLSVTAGQVICAGWVLQGSDITLASGSGNRAAYYSTTSTTPSTSPTITPSSQTWATMFLYGSAGGGSGSGLGYLPLSMSISLANGSTSAYATKGNIYQTSIDFSVNKVSQYFTGTGTYHMELVTVNTSNVITSVDGSSDSVVVSAAGSHVFTFSTPVSYTAGTRYALLAVRTDGTSTSSVNVSYPGSGSPEAPFQTGIGGVRYATLAPAVGDSILYSTSTFVAGQAFLASF